MARMHHQLEFLESEVREPRQAGLGAVRTHIGICVAPKHGRVDVWLPIHRCAPLCVIRLAPPSARQLPLIKPDAFESISIRHCGVPPGTRDGAAHRFELPQADPVAVTSKEATMRYLVTAVLTLSLI